MTNSQKGQMICVKKKLHKRHVKYSCMNQVKLLEHGKNYSES